VLTATGAAGACSSGRLTRDGLNPVMSGGGIPESEMQQFGRVTYRIKKQRNGVRGQMNHKNRRYIPTPSARFLVAGFAQLFLCVLALAQVATPPVVTVSLDKGPTSVRARHLMGFEATRSNATGTLTIQLDSVQFQKTGTPAAEIKIASVQDISLGSKSRQVGGLPMTLGKAAVPFGGGRVVSLFAHKKYDTLSLQYVDANGGIHGAIFQVDKDQAATLKDELVAKGAGTGNGKAAPPKQNVEVPRDGE
jgi:hypothetical protein